jgi:hypothetical protein
MSKMGLHDPFGHLKHKLWPKEGQGIKLAIWLLTIKSQESPWFPFVQVACHIPLEAFDKGYNFFSNVISIGGLHTKLWAPKLQESQLWEFWDSHFKSPRTKWHLGAGLVARHRVYYKGKCGGFPQVQAVVSLVNLCLPMACPCTKNVPTMH